MRALTQLGACRLPLLLCCAIATGTILPAGAAIASTPRFALSGSATLVPDAPVQRATGWRLTAKLTPVAGPAQAPSAQLGGGFTLVAYADSVATACYNDTIFRDDFDGDGL